MLQKFHDLSTNYEEIIGNLSIKLSESSLESEKSLKDLQNQHKCDIMRMELNYNKLIESQALSHSKKEREMLETFQIVSKDLEKTLKICKNDLEETNMRFQDFKQTRLNNKARHLFSLDEFDKNLKSSIMRIEDSQSKNLPLKLEKNEENKRKIKSFSSNPSFDRKKLINLKEIFNRNQAKTKKLEKNQGLNENNDSYDSKMGSEISVFLANQLNIYQEESRLNISMPKDEGKWDPAMDSEKEENIEYSEIRKAFEIFDNLNLFEAVRLFKKYKNIQFL